MNAAIIGFQANVLERILQKCQVRPCYRHVIYLHRDKLWIQMCWRIDLSILPTNCSEMNREYQTTYSSQVPYDWETRSRYLDLPFPMSEYERRVKLLREIMSRDKL